MKLRKVTVKTAVNVILLGILLSIFGNVYAGGVDKIEICHWDDEGGYYEPIAVGAPSVPKHMEKHGDVPNPFVSANDDPIWSNAEAQGGVCADRCAAEGGTFTGAWWTTIAGVASVCQCTCG